MTKYLDSAPFSAPPASDAYRKGWDAIDWGGKKKPSQGKKGSPKKKGKSKK